MQNEEIPEKIRTFILLNTFNLDSKECKKMSKYFLAHKNYLNNLSFIVDNSIVSISIFLNKVLFTYSSLLP